MTEKTAHSGSKNAPRSRRRLLQLLAAGGVVAGAGRLPETWVRPVVNEAVLPAHAQLSPSNDENEVDLAADLSDFENTVQLPQP